MKKLIAIAMFICGTQALQAQMSEGGKTDCSAEALNALYSCLASNNVTYDLTNATTADGSAAVYITGQGNPPPGQIQSCIAHYNQLRSGCPNAPSVINNTSNNENGNGNQIGKTPH